MFESGAANHRGRQPKTPGAIGSAEAQKQFADRKSEERSERTVRKPVIVISRQSEVIAHPKPERHACIGVMRADNVKQNKRGE